VRRDGTSAPTRAVCLGMRRLLIAAVACLIVALSASLAGAKDEYWAQICGRNGCKIIKDRFVAAALTSEAEEHGSRRRALDAGSAYRVRYAVPRSARPTGLSYWLTTKRIAFLIRQSQPSVAALFTRARAGVRPFFAAASRVAFRNFTLRAPGLVFELHPTDRPITVQAAATSSLKVCPVGTSFAGRWRRGCRTLREHPLLLPATSGAIHVLFRITTAAATSTRVSRLSLRWHCVDHRFGLQRGQSRIPPSRPVFDC
jgi:hypothetical protein